MKVESDEAQTSSFCSICFGNDTGTHPTLPNPRYKGRTRRTSNTNQWGSVTILVLAVTCTKCFPGSVAKTQGADGAWCSPCSLYSLRGAHGADGVRQDLISI